MSWGALAALNPMTWSSGGNSVGQFIGNLFPKGGYLGSRGFTGDNITAALEHPLSFSTGGLLGGEGGTFQIPHFGGGIDTNSLRGGVNNRSIRDYLLLMGLSGYMDPTGGGMFGMNTTGAAEGADVGGTAGSAGLIDPVTGTSDVTGSSQLWAPSAGGSGGVGFGTAANTGQGTSWLSTFGKGLEIAGAGYNLYNARQMQMLAKKQQDQKQRYQDQINTLMANPSSVTNLPGYEAGMEAVRRSLAAQGYSGSTNMMASMAQYGQTAYNNQLAMLAQMAGNPLSPDQYMNTNFNSMDATTAALNRLGTMAQYYSR